MLPSYARFLSYKGLVETLPASPFAFCLPQPSPVATARASSGVTEADAASAGLAFPVQRICYSCHAKDKFDEEPISHLQGKVSPIPWTTLREEATTRWWSRPSPKWAPTRPGFYGMMTDCEPSAVKVGMPVD